MGEVGDGWVGLISSPGMLARIRPAVESDCSCHRANRRKRSSLNHVGSGSEIRLHSLESLGHRLRLGRIRNRSLVVWLVVVDLLILGGVGPRVGPFVTVLNLEPG